MPASVLARVELAPRDPILGLNEAFAADPNPKKVNLGAGVYYDDNGKLPLLECVKRAEAQLLERSPSWGYLPIDGIAAYDREVQKLVFGADSAAVKDGRTLTVQALGGTGGLKIGADFLKRVLPMSEVWISDPSWENHRALFEHAGFTVKSYPYYDAKTHGLDFAGMIGKLGELPAGAIVVLHIVCHNPTGVDLSQAQWDQVIEVVKTRGLVPFLDMAYQGFADGIEADGAVVQRFAKLDMPVFVSSSFSKSFSLYGERVGALSVAASSADEAQRVLSQLKRVVRTNYSNPPTHGGQLVANVLASAELRALWEQELAGMRDRIKLMRRALVDKLHARIKGASFDFVVAQRGMFSYSGLSKEQVARLRTEYAIYAVDSGRICVACLNSKNIDYVAEAIASVMR
jgi:aromatic-amino-acid transaminase